MWFTDNPRQDRCHVQVSDHTGFHFFQCSKPDKYQICRGDRVHRVCGTHRNMMLRRGWMDDPFEDDANGG